MIPSETPSLKKILLWSLIPICGMVSAYLMFISVVSIWIGIGHAHQGGYWVPIAAGITLFFSVSWVFLRLISRITRRMEQENRVNI